VLPLQEGATLLGTSGPSRFTRRVGRAGVERYGWLIHRGPATLARVEGALRRSGWRGILLGRLLPGLRIATSIAAGVFGIPFDEFLPAVAVGGLRSIGAFDRVGYALGPAAQARFERVALPPGALVSLVTVALVGSLIRNAKREVPGLARGGGGAAVAARPDGLPAGVIALLATNGIVGVARFAARLLGHAIPRGAEERGTGLRLRPGGPVFLLAASTRRGRRAPRHRAPALGAAERGAGPPPARAHPPDRPAPRRARPAPARDAPRGGAGRGRGGALARVRRGPRRAPPARRAPATCGKGLTRG